MFKVVGGNDPLSDIVIYSYGIYGVGLISRFGTMMMNFPHDLV